MAASVPTTLLRTLDGMGRDLTVLRARRRIGLVAHDNMKADLLDWAWYNRTVLANHDLIGTGTTGALVAERLGLPVQRLHSGPLGGDQQLGAMIADRTLDVLVFFWDPLSPQPHDPDVKALLRIAVVWNLPVACNRATADFMISSPLLASEYERSVPVYDGDGQRGTRVLAQPA
jgi:methylglyoxal synthase